MFEADSRDDRNSRVRLVGGCATGVLLGVGLVQADAFASLGNVPAGLFGASSGNALQVLQSVGILLPLVVGLLRFTTNGRSKVNGRTNDHLLLGILGLVLAGASAVIAGMFTGMAGVLKLSLLFVLFTFILVGLAAGAMFGEFSAEIGSSGDATDEGISDERTDEEISDESTEEVKSTESVDARAAGSDETESEVDSAPNEDLAQSEDDTAE